MYKRTYRFNPRFCGVLSDTDIKLFMSTGIWPLFMYLKSIRDDEKLFYVHARIKGLANSLGIRINMDTTIEDVLGRFTGTFSPWVPHIVLMKLCFSM